MNLLEMFEAFWGHLRDILGHLVIYLGIPRHFGAFCRRFGDIWRHLETFGNIIGTF